MDRHLGIQVQDQGAADDQHDADHSGQVETLFEDEKADQRHQDDAHPAPDGVGHPQRDVLQHQ